jgi:protein-L-isoaspartate(D-aspartate) O-methyltransferase
LSTAAASLKKAYASQGTSNQELIARLKENGILTSAAVESAMLKVDRGDYSADPTQAYVDTPLPIGLGQTISAPHMHAMALQLLEPVLVPGARVLDVGAGSGYLAACLAHLVGLKGRVIGIEVLRPLVEKAIFNIRKHNAALLDSGRVTIKLGDGWSGDAQNAPFHAIHVGAAAEEVPKALVDQLREGGRMIIPLRCWQAGDRTDAVPDRQAQRQNQEDGHHGRAVCAPGSARGRMGRAKRSAGW